MELVIASAIVSIAYVYAPILRLHAAKVLRLELPSGVVTPEAPAVDAPPPKPVELPRGVEEWCTGWYDESARIESREAARELFAQLGDWDKVMQELTKER